MIKTYHPSKLRDVNNIKAHGYCSRLRDGGSPHEFYRVSSLTARQFSWDVPEEEAFLCDKDTVLGDTIKETLCTLKMFV
jgi:hypothetical protein